jgi:hypothetical membrane protein
VFAAVPIRPHNRAVRSSTPWWALLSATAAPVLLIGGWTLAARLQSGGFDSSAETISALARATADERWVMTSALVGLGACHVVTAVGLPAAAPGRAVLALGGISTVLVAAFPLPDSGSSTAHATAATAAFVALAVWPAVAWRRGATVPAALRPAVASGAAVALVGLVAWFAVSLSTGGRTGLAERVAAGAQAIWPLVTVVSTRAAVRRASRPGDGVPR